MGGLGLLCLMFVGRMGALTFAVLRNGLCVAGDGLTRNGGLR